MATPSVRVREACCFQNRNTGGYSWVHACSNDTQNSWFEGTSHLQDNGPGKHLLQVNTVTSKHTDVAVVV